MSKLCVDCGKPLTAEELEYLSYICNKCETLSMGRVDEMEKTYRRWRLNYQWPGGYGVIDTIISAGLEFPLSVEDWKLLSDTALPDLRGAPSAMITAISPLRE